MARFVRQDKKSIVFSLSWSQTTFSTDDLYYITAMFCGILAERNNYIDLPDCDYQGMMEFLRYIYTEEVGFNGDNISQLLYLAEKYMIPSPTNRCILFLREHLDSSNIFCVLKHSTLIENKSLWRSCWKFIDKEAKDVLESSEFFEMDRSDLIELVKRNTLNVKEIELFTAINLHLPRVLHCKIYN